MDRANDRTPTQRQAAHVATAIRLDATEALLVAAVVIALLYALTVAVARPGAPADVPTTTIRVSDTQTLWSLASEYRVSGFSTAQTAELIKDLNGMDDSSLQAGARILVPATTELATALALR